MTNCSDDQTPVTRREVFASYLVYYSSVWSQGNGKVCEDPQVTERAKHVLLTEDNPAERFRALPFYPTLSECVEYTGTECRNCVFRFIKVAEMLEMLCVNLFLFPWKKEIKTLKKFTGYFVYNIQPVLPQETTKSILQSIGYCFENDTEYKLSNHVDLDFVRRMGFELFLARLECEYLLEVMSQRSHAECLEILSSRASPHSPRWSVGSTEEQSTRELHPAGQEALKEDRLRDEETSPFKPGSPQDQEVLQSIKPSHLGAQEALDSTGCAEGTPPRSFMSDDRSILEMQENYPDLAFRQKPIFTKPQTASRNKDWAKDPPTVQLHTVISEMSGPQSIALHTESTTAHRKLQVPESVIEPQSTDEKPCELRVGSVLRQPGFSREGATEVMELTEKLGKLQVKDFSAEEPLKYPTEETTQAQQCRGCRDCAGVSPLCSPTEKQQTGRSGSGPAAELLQDHPIKEPPHSFYIPNCASEGSPSVALPTGHQGELQPAGQWSHGL